MVGTWPYRVPVRQSPPHRRRPDAFWSARHVSGAHPRDQKYPARFSALRPKINFRRIARCARCDDVPPCHCASSASGTHGRRGRCQSGRRTSPQQQARRSLVSRTSSEGEVHDRSSPLRSAQPARSCRARHAGVRSARDPPALSRPFPDAARERATHRRRSARRHRSATTVFAGVALTAGTALHVDTTSGKSLARRRRSIEDPP